MVMATTVPHTEPGRVGGVPYSRPLCLAGGVTGNWYRPVLGFGETGGTTMGTQRNRRTWAMLMACALAVAVAIAPGASADRDDDDG